MSHGKRRFELPSLSTFKGTIKPWNTGTKWWTDEPNIVNELMETPWIQRKGKFRTKKVLLHKVDNTDIEHIILRYKHGKLK